MLQRVNIFVCRHVYARMDDFFYVMVGTDGGWMAAWRAGSSRLVLDQSVYVMLCTVLGRRHFKHVCCT